MNKHETMLETFKHKQKVNILLNMIIQELSERAIAHDDTKLEDCEVDVFAEYTPKLANCTFGSDEYKEYLKQMKPALDHHYANNSHHPEYYANGISGMHLVDLIEMICDWKASSMRHKDGNIRKSLEHNKQRFNIDEQLTTILRNTISLLDILE